jgi:hypothetical protein
VVVRVVVMARQVVLQAILRLKLRVAMVLVVVAAVAAGTLVAIEVVGVSVGDCVWYVVAATTAAM